MIKAKLFSFFVGTAILSLPMQSCSKYTVTTSQQDPADSYYKEKVTASYFWGLINNPGRLVDTSCGSAGLDEVKVVNNLGYSLIHVATLGIVNIVRLQWKCHKPEPVVGFQP
ncbi:MAG TPA: hypothetical protein VFL47_13685 [Flavisolibacter sp.]|nr:hypothetical protein [Flavisolibacter sp.]